MKTVKRILSVLLVAVMMLTIMPLGGIELKASAAQSNNWVWPTSNHTIKNDWPNYSSGSYHGGTDFPVALNTPVYSTCDGEVVSVQSLTTSYGVHVKIKAVVNGSVVYIRYCHLTSYVVSNGQKVSAGTLIGYSGSTGNSTGPHLHYEVRNANDTYNPNLNPRNYLPGSSLSYKTNSSSEYPESTSDIIFWDISNYDVTQGGFGDSEIPTLNGRYKIWFKKLTSETNYYINLYLDGKQVRDHASTDGSGYLWHEINSSYLSNGVHEFYLEYVFTNGIYRVAKKFNVIHTHSHTNSITKQPTCTVTGIRTYKCIGCSSSYTESVAALGHSYSSTYTTDTVATCTTAGSKSRHCTRCSAKTDVTSIPAKGHTTDSGTVTTQPTCTKEGVKTFKCTVCGETLKTAPVEKKAHTYNTATVKPTCTKNGSSVTKCTVCGDIKSSETIPATGHKKTVTVPAQKATCTLSGNTAEEKCTVCSTVLSELKVIPATGHKKTVSVPAQKATCTTPGNTAEEMCTVCSTVLSELKVVPATGHTDKNSDNKCDTCGASLGTQNPSENCSCNCHKSGFMGFIWKIINFFNKLFKSNPVCACGVKHY